MIRHLVATATSLSGAFACVAAVAVFAWSSDAQAVDDRGDILIGRHPRSYESPQRWALEFRGLLYAPNVDDDPAFAQSHATPYKDTFGTMKRLAVQLEVDYQAVRIPHLGTLGPGIAAGFTEMSNNTYILGHPNEPAAEQTTLDIYPMYLVAVLRADVLKRELKIPLVPYVKGGIGFALWRASNDARDLDVHQPDQRDDQGRGTHLRRPAGGRLDVQHRHLRPGRRREPRSVDRHQQHVHLRRVLRRAPHRHRAVEPLLVGSSGWAFGLTVEF